MNTETDAAAEQTHAAPSEDAGFMTGAVLAINGGQYMANG